MTTAQKGKMSRLEPVAFQVAFYFHPDKWSSGAGAQRYTFRCLGTLGYVNFNVDLIEADSSLPVMDRPTRRKLRDLLRERLEGVVGLKVPPFDHTVISDEPWKGNGSEGEKHAT